MTGKTTKLLNAETLGDFCRDAAVFVHTGIPLGDDIPTMTAELPESDPYREALAGVGRSLAAGAPLSEALAGECCFPKYLCETVAIGERAGRLDETLADLSKYYTQMASFRQRLRSALLYPVLLLGMMTVVVAVLLFSVLPVFSQVLSQFNAEAAATTNVVMRVGTGVCTVILVLLAALLLCLGIAALLSRTAKGSAFLRRTLQRSPLTAKAARSVATAQFASSLSTLLHSGVSFEDALDALLPGVSNEALAAKLCTCRTALASGASLEQALSQAGVFSGRNSRLVCVACRTGTLDRAIGDIAENCSQQATERLENAAAAVEPALVAFLSVIIGAILLSAMLPLIQILSAIG